MDFDESVIYLEEEDFTKDGKLKVLQDKPVVIMLGGNFCSFCKIAKPELQSFAKKMDKVYPACILIDGSKSEKKLGQKMGKWVPNFKGVPMFVAYKNGKYHSTHNGDRTAVALIEFSKKL
jgi:thiol-disulfide isomerase/thioredoxin